MLVFLPMEHLLQVGTQSPGRTNREELGTPQAWKGG